MKKTMSLICNATGALAAIITIVFMLLAIYNTWTESFTFEFMIDILATWVFALIILAVIGMVAHENR